MDRPSSSSRAAERGRVPADGRETYTDARVDKNHYRKDDAVKEQARGEHGTTKLASAFFCLAAVAVSVAMDETLHADVISSQSPREEKPLERGAVVGACAVPGW